MFCARQLLAQSHLSGRSTATAIANKLLFSKTSIKLLGEVSKYSTQVKTVTSDNQTVILSESCIKRLKELSQPNQYLRVLVDSGGCSGLEYKFSVDSNISKDDQLIEKDGGKILVDQETLNYIKGATVDYYEELIRSGFRIINNPNSEQGCSCGSSFSIKI